MQCMPQKIVILKDDNSNISGLQFEKITFSNCGMHYVQTVERYTYVAGKIPKNTACPIEDYII
jgi:hypothetical protein